MGNAFVIRSVRTLQNSVENHVRKRHNDLGRFIIVRVHIKHLWVYAHFLSLYLYHIVFSIYFNVFFLMVQKKKKKNRKWCVWDEQKIKLCVKAKCVTEKPYPYWISLIKCKTPVYDEMTILILVFRQSYSHAYRHYMYDYLSFSLASHSARPTLFICIPKTSSSSLSSPAYIHFLFVFGVIHGRSNRFCPQQR